VPNEAGKESQSTRGTEATHLLDLVLDLLELLDGEQEGAVDGLSPVVLGAVGPRPLALLLGGPHGERGEEAPFARGSRVLAPCSERGKAVPAAAARCGEKREEQTQGTEAGGAASGPGVWTVTCGVFIPPV